MAELIDVVVVGLGPAGEEIGGRLAEAGLRVVGIDKGLVGGECPYWGCIPSKMMIRSANLLAEARRIPGLAGSSAVVPDWDPVARRIREEATDTWDDKVAVDRFTGKGGRFLRGQARLDGPGKVIIDDRILEPSIGTVLATGATAWIPPIPGLSDTPYWTNREAIECASLPEDLLVLGGGAIGVELAQVFARFGVKVRIVDTADRLLPAEEPESSALIATIFAEEGIEVVTSAGITCSRFEAERFHLDLKGGETHSASRLLVATGRVPDLGELGVASIGLDESARSVPVDGRLRVAPGVWAAGDITGVGAFTHVAMYQAGFVVEDILRTAGRTDPNPKLAVGEAEYHALPRVTFTDPEIGSVGRTELAAREANLQVRVGTAQIPDSARGWIHAAGNAGFIKIVEDADRHVLIGATSAGPVGGEVLGLLALAVHAEVPTQRLGSMIYAYPTFHGAIAAALEDLRT